jgi:hypothetical protein
MVLMGRAAHLGLLPGHRPRIAVAPMMLLICLGSVSWRTSSIPA